MQNNKKWFSIIMAMWLVIFINLIALGILEYAVPFSRETKNIENVAVSYYQADSWIENALFYLKSENFEPWTESWTSLTNDAISSSFDIIWVWEKLPPIWQGDSEYNQDWNQIAIWNPIQLEIWYWKVDFDNAIFAFRVPDLNNWNFTLTLSWWFDDLPVVNWQISSQNNTLNATGSYITPNSICNSWEVFFDCDLDLSGLQWIDLNWEETSDQEIWNFYDNNCDSVWSWCILKLSIINKLEDDNNNISIPYLEWKIDFNSLVPLRYSIIETDWKAYGYKKSLKVRIPQQTTNEAFDFTVFQ